MKTTVHIPDSLLQEAQKLAQQENTTLKAMIQEGLRRVIDDRRQKPRFKLRPASFRGEGLQPDMEQASWQEIRSLAYEGHGG